MCSRPAIALATASLAAALAASVAAAEVPLDIPKDPDAGFKCSWHEIVPVERRSIAATEVVLERPWLTLRFDAGVFYPLEACGEPVGLAWKGEGFATVHDAGVERTFRLHDRLENVPGEVSLEAAVIVASDGAIGELLAAVEGSGAAWEETPLPLDVRTMVQARIASFHPVDGRSSRPGGELLWAPEPSLGGVFVDFRSGGIKRRRDKLDLPVKWLTYTWTNAGFTGGEPGLLRVRPVGVDDPLSLGSLPAPSSIAEDPYGWTSARSPFDLVDVQAHVLFEPTAGLDRDLKEVRMVSRLEVEARDAGARWIPLWLTEGRSRTLGEQWEALRVKGVRVDDGGVRFHRPPGRLYVELPEPAAEGRRYVVEVHFEGEIIEPRGQHDITALGAGTLYPTSTSGDRYTFSTTVTAPKFWKIVATGTRIEEIGDGKAVTVTSRTKRTVGRAMAFVTDARVETHPSPGEGLPALRILRATETMAVNAKFADQVYEHLGRLVELLGPFPYEELEIVERRGGGSITTTPGVIAIPAFDAPPDQVITSRAGRVSLLQALTRQYFGADIGALSYHDTWLVEALAVQAECYLLEEYGKPGRCAGNLRSMRDAWTDMLERHRSAWLIGPLWMGSTAGAPSIGGTFAEPNTMARGPLVMHKLRVLLGDGVMRELLRRTGRLYGGSRLTTKTFLVLAQSTSGMDLRTFFYGWVYATPQQPVLRLLWRPEEAEDGTWTLNLGGVIESGRDGDALPFLSPVMVRVKFGKEEAWQRIVLTHEPADLQIHGIPAEPKKVDVDWQTFPGKVEVEKVK